MGTVPTGEIDHCYDGMAAAAGAATVATGATDNCPGTLSKTASTVGDCSATVTVTVTDGCGNFADSRNVARGKSADLAGRRSIKKKSYHTVAAAEAAAMAATGAPANRPR